MRNRWSRAGIASIACLTLAVGVLAAHIAAREPSPGADGKFPQSAIVLTDGPCCEHCAAHSAVIAAAGGDAPACCANHGESFSTLPASAEQGAGPCGDDACCDSSECNQRGSAAACAACPFHADSPGVCESESCPLDCSLDALADDDIDQGPCRLAHEELVSNRGAKDDASPAIPPEPLDEPDNANPIDPDRPLNSFAPGPDSSEPGRAHARDEDDLRSIIEQELPDARDDEREIWFEELKGLPPQMIRELLRLRRRFGSQQPARVQRAPDPAEPPELPHGDEPHVDVPAPPPPFVDSGEVAPVPDDGDISLRLESTIAALRQARLILLNNIANAGTIGFKRSQARFEDLFYEQVQPAGEAGSGSGHPNGAASPLGIHVGWGTRLAGVIIDQRQGALLQTGAPLDVAITGAGFFQLQGTGGQVVYSRAGAFAVNAEGMIVTAASSRGRALEPPIVLPADAIDISISADGVVSARHASSGERSPIGQIQTVTFVNPQGLMPLGENLFAASRASGEPQIGAPGTGGRGALRQGFLEGSNVTLSDELAALQRLQLQIRTVQQASSLVVPTPEPGPATIPLTRRPLPSQTSEHTPPDRARR